MEHHAAAAHIMNILPSGYWNKVDRKENKREKWQIDAALSDVTNEGGCCGPVVGSFFLSLVFQ